MIALMTGATTAIGALPTYDTVGALAPWLLTFLRVLQGLSAGGEFGGAVSALTEFAPPGRRGLYGSWQSFTVALGLLGGAGAAALLATLLSEDQLGDWGWRLPFLLTLPMGLGALWLRLRLAETPAFAAERELRRPAAGELAAAVALGAGRVMGWAAAGYTLLVVLPSYLRSALDASFQQALPATVLANLGFAATILPAGLLSDRIGRRPVMPAGAGLVVVLAVPLLNLLQDGGTSNAAKGVALHPSDELGLPAAAKEAYAFAVLGFLTAHGLPGTHPQSTGARHPSVLGSITPGRTGLRLPPPAQGPPERLVLETPRRGPTDPIS
ncbi:major facilitator superfamily MFS_1 [Actinobacteria bacterium OK074]|nr:major facilitator superfamily MFS_1 [Actinobacteria bacterium OK074]